jgi:peptidylglycine monooxygenase
MTTSSSCEDYLAGGSRLVVGLAGQLFAVERPWGELPAEVAGGAISDVATLSNGDVVAYVRYDPMAEGSRGRPALVVLNSAGAFQRAFGAGVVADAHGLASDSSDRLIAVDRDAHQVVIFDRHGRIERRLGTRHVPGSPFRHPTAAAVAPNGDIYVADGYGGFDVHHFSADGGYIGKWGGAGGGNGQFLTPHGIIVLYDGRVLVADRDADRIQVFDPDGRFIEAWTHFFRPMCLCLTPEGRICVSDQVPRLTMIDDGGKVIDACRPVLNIGHGIACDPRGDIVLAEPRERRLTRMRRFSTDMNS